MEKISYESLDDESLSYSYIYLQNRRKIKFMKQNVNKENEIENANQILAWHAHPKQQSKVNLMAK